MRINIDTRMTVSKVGHFCLLEFWGIIYKTIIVTCMFLKQVTQYFCGMFLRKRNAFLILILLVILEIQMLKFAAIDFLSFENQAYVPGTIFGALSVSLFVCVILDCI